MGYAERFDFNRCMDEMERMIIDTSAKRVRAKAHAATVDNEAIAGEALADMETECMGLEVNRG